MFVSIYSCWANRSRLVDKQQVELILQCNHRRRRGAPVTGETLENMMEIKTFLLFSRVHLRKVSLLISSHSWCVQLFTGSHVIHGHRCLLTPQTENILHTFREISSVSSQIFYFQIKNKSGWKQLLKPQLTGMTVNCIYLYSPSVFSPDWVVDAVSVVTATASSATVIIQSLACGSAVSGEAVFSRCAAAETRTVTVHYGWSEPVNHWFTPQHWTAFVLT